MDLAAQLPGLAPSSAADPEAGPLPGRVPGWPNSAFAGRPSLGSPCSLAGTLASAHPSIDVGCLGASAGFLFSKDTVNTGEGENISIFLVFT